MVKNGGQYVRVHPCRWHLENQHEKYLPFQNIGPNENVESQKNNNAPPESYLNDYLNINVNQFANDINELTKSISDLSLHTDLLAELVNSHLVSNELFKHHK